MSMRDLEPYGVNQPDQGIDPRHMRRAIRRQGQVEFEIFVRQLEVDRMAEFERQDLEVIGEACESAMEAEFRLVDRIRADAHGDPTKLELGATKIASFSSWNNARARRRFGRLG
jgi:hypothetical protein